MFLAIWSLFSALFSVGGGDQVAGWVGVTLAAQTVGLIGVVTGLLVIVSGVMMYVQPKQHVIWGVLALVFSIVSILGFGGLFLGLLLGVVGGILGIVFRPAQPMTAPMPQAWQAPPPQ